MTDCCEKAREAVASAAPEQHAPACHSEARKTDYLLWVSGSIVAVCYLIAAVSGDGAALPNWLRQMSFGIFELLNQMWWGLVAAVVFVGLLDRVPQTMVMQALGKGGSTRGVLRATLAGVLLDLCSHGILMVGAKLYQRGASLGQLMAFLIASPWNSLSLTIILVSLIGLGWTLLFILLSMLIGVISGLLFDRLVANGILPANPNAAAEDEESANSANGLLRDMFGLLKQAQWTPVAIGRLLRDGLRDSRMVFRWLLFGLVLATAIRAFVPLDTYQALFGPTVLGLLLTLVAATIIEVCSEGSTPIAADLLTRAAAPGNGFTFLMAGVATDYTEIMVLKDLTKSWKIALFLPLVTLPQILLMGWLLNSLA